ncbi:MAG: glycosyltransferase family 8 protein [Lachnospiraceae bacterium]|nr:glycosyltransferase family 8 protein [Lachnospiraceae bacterium]
MNNPIPIFFACNDRYVPYLDVAIISLISHVSPDREYRITVLKSDITEHNQEMIRKHATENVSINFYDVSKMLEPTKDKLPNMFYYSLAAYYRFFIETAFPQYEKAIYLDCDVILLNDIAKLYDTDVSNYLVGAVYEQNTDRSPVFTNYVEEIIGIPHNTYFNSGVMVMNLSEFRKEKVQEKFLWMLDKYHFDSLAPDQEYLNVICHGKVKYLPNGWNKHSFPEPPEGELNLCHFALSNKPWHYSETINGEYFWEYAKLSEFYSFLLESLNNYSDADKQRDYEGFTALLKSIDEIYKSDRTFRKLWFRRKSAASVTCSAKESETADTVFQAV